MNRFMIIFLSNILCLSVFSQISYTGKLLDENSQPLPYANVVLLSLPDSAFVTGTVSDEGGSFSLQAEEGNHLVKISSIGYATVYIPASSAGLGAVRMAADAQLLNEVVVKADLPKVQLKGDAQVTQIQNTILEKAGTGNDLLNKLPGVSADGGSVNVFGAGKSEIYINGRKMRDASELDQLSSDNVKRIEVIRNPGARYDATVKAVIRIYTKRAQGDGFGFDERFYSKYQYKWDVLNQFNFNYRKGGFDLSGMVFGSNPYSEDKKTMATETTLGKLWNQQSDICIRSRSEYFSSMLSANIQFGDTHSAGVRYYFNRTPKEKFDIQPISSKVFLNKELYEENLSQGWQNNPATSHTFNAYYNGQVGSWNIDFNGDGLWSYTRMIQDMTEQYNPPSGGLQNQRITSQSRNENTFYAAKLLLSRPLWNGTLSFGGEYTYTDRINPYINDQGILDDDHSNIKENSSSAFLEYGRSFGKLQAQIGIRYEHLVSDYYEAGVRIGEQSRTYDNVFPSVALAFPVGKAQFSISYTGSINRPSYWMLRSNVTYANRYTYEAGNPLLRPSLINRLSLDASYKWIYFNARYTRQNDAIVQGCEAYSEEQPTISLLVPANKYNMDQLHATLTLSPTIGIWSPQLSLMFLQQWYKVETPKGLQNFNNPVGSFAWYNNFRLPWDMLLDVDAWLETPGEQESNHIDETAWSLDLSLRKDFLNERFSLQLQGKDLFNSSSARSTLFSGNRTMTVDSQTCRSFSITLRYKFNTVKSKYKGTGAGSEQKSRM